MSTHTPTPWNYGSQPKTAHKVFGTLPGRTYGRLTATSHDCGGGISERTANAAFIVRAVNSHEDLLAALTVAEKLLAISYNPGGDERIVELCRSSCQQACNQARAAIAKATNFQERQEASES